MPTGASPQLEIVIGNGPAEDGLKVSLPKLP